MNTHRVQAETILVFICNSGSAVVS